MGRGAAAAARRRSVHRFTVDRHLVETCIEASRADPAGRPARPADGGRPAARHRQGRHCIDHSVAGEPIARAVAGGWASTPTSADLVATLVRWHLLLPETATTRDPEDPATVAGSPSVVADREELDLLAALTEADARATSAKAWTTWRAALVAGLVRPRRRAALECSAAPPPGRAPRGRGPRRSARTDPARVVVRSSRTTDGADGHGASPRRPGRPAGRRRRRARAAAGLGPGRPGLDRRTTSRRLGVARSTETDLDAAVLRQRIEAVGRGPLGPGRPAAHGRGPTLGPDRGACGPRPPRRRPCSRCAPRDRPGVVAPGLPGAGPARTSRCAPRTWTRSGPRPWTCSTSRSPAPVLLTDRAGRGRPRTRYARRWARRRALEAAIPCGRRVRADLQASRPTSQATSEDRLVRHSLRPPRRDLQEPARQGPAVRGRHRRHRARDPDRAARGGRRAAGRQGVRRRGQGAGPRVPRSARR